MRCIWSFKELGVHAVWCTPDLQPCEWMIVCIIMIQHKRAQYLTQVKTVDIWGKKSGNFSITSSIKLGKAIEHKGLFKNLYL